ncbi:hypothetical protein, variant [Aphanomyces invadans]|nr:hypothetical protein, variant [Aphanomyces invadans]ETV92259.1 hypothetical protein, variant [Aphanomyces invadans]|eukprot:XP_008879223.1 hypothetical protein, variant [Aphanomyces invadans]
MVNLSVNRLVSLAAVAYLTHLQVVDLSFNRLVDVEPLMFCTALVNVALRGNRLSSTKGIENLKHLERLDMSDNVVAQPDAIRSLSLNTMLSTLLLQGNPIASTPDYRVCLLDLVPQVSLLDGRRQSRQHYRCAVGKDTSSYAHMYDARKQFRCMQAKAHGVPSAKRKPSAHCFRTGSSHDGTDDADAAMVVNTLKCFSMADTPTAPPSPPTAHPRVHAGYCPKSLRQASAVPKLKGDKHARQKTDLQHQLTDYPGYMTLFERVAVSSGGPPVDDKHGSTTRAKTSTAHPVPTTTSAAGKPYQVAPKRKNVISPPKVKVQPSRMRRQLAFDKRRALDDPSCGSLNESQVKVLGVIQRLIQHKRQTLAALGE